MAAESESESAQASNIECGSMASIAGLLSLALAYSLQRVVDVLLRDEPNPVAVVWTERIAMYDRLLTASFIAGMVGVAWFALARARLPLTVRTLEVGAVVVACVVLLQGLLLP